MLCRVCAGVVAIWWSAPSSVTGLSPVRLTWPTHTGWAHQPHGRRWAGGAHKPGTDTHVCIGI